MHEVRNYILESGNLPNTSFIKSQLTSLLRSNINSTSQNKFSKLEKLFSEHRIYFITQSEFSKHFQEELSDEMLDALNSSRGVNPHYLDIGLLFAFTDFDLKLHRNSSTPGVYLVYDPTDFIDILGVIDDEEKIKEYVDTLFYTIDHEIIHKAQYRKIGDYTVSKKTNVTKGSTSDYFSHHTEIEPYAHQTIKEMEREGLSREEILDTIKRTMTHPDDGHIISMSLHNYSAEVKSQHPESFNRYLKTLYQYAQES